jgi:hypothetical protein
MPKAFGRAVDMRKRVISMIVATVAMTMLGLVATPASATTSGDWTLYPSLTSTYQAQVLQPVNNDGTSNWSVNTEGSIPIRFTLFRQTQTPVVFQSIGSDESTTNDYSYLSFAPASPTSFGDITNLTADFTFSLGSSHGGALRWDIGTSAGSLHVYYGVGPNWTGTGGSGVNMIGQPDLRYDTSGIAGGSFYDTYVHAVELLGTTNVNYAALVLDGGWQADQRVSLKSATVNDNTWTKGKFHVTDLPASAVFHVAKKDSTPRAAINDTMSVSPPDTSGVYRVNGDPSYSDYPAYEYNLSVPSLNGTGTYKLTIKIGGQQVGSAKFDIR